MSEALAVQTNQLPEAVTEHDKTVPMVERYRGISMERASSEQTMVLTAPIPDSDIEVKPDGMLYLPEIKYRRRLIQAFGPGGWALMPTSKFDMRDNTVMRQYALYVGGRFISEAVGEQDYIASNPNMTYATSAEGCKSNALMRCCKDLGIASELWDPGFIEKWKAQFAVKVWNQKTSKWNWRRKDREPFFWEKKEGKQEPTNNPQEETPPFDSGDSVGPDGGPKSNGGRLEPGADSRPRCPKCNGDTVYRPSGETKTGKTYPAFWGCANYNGGCKGTVKDSDWQASKSEVHSDPDPGPIDEPGTQG
jgi:hypothetical protein